MNYKISLLVIIILSISLFISCGDTKPAKSQETITFWHFWSEPYQKKTLDSIIESFEEKYNINVETTELSWNDGKTKLFAAFNSKTAPDVLELGSDWVAQFSSSDVLSSMDADEMEITRFIDYSLTPSYWAAQLYAIPWVVDTRVMYVNNSLVRKAGIQQETPLTYEQLLENSQLVNIIDDKYGYGATGSDEHRLYKKIVSMFWSNGGEILDSDGFPMLNTPENIEALEKYVKLSQAGYVETQKALDNKFAQGDIAYYISGSWLIEKINNINPELDYSVALVPGFGSNTGISFAGGEYLAISKDSEYQEVSKKFIKFMTDGINALEFCKKVNAAGFPADKNYFDDDFYNNFPKRELFAKQLSHAKMTPVHPRWLDIEQIIETATVIALYGQMTAKEALDKAQMELQDLVKVD